MRHLATGTQRYIGKVGSYAFDDDGKLMAYTVRGDQRLGNGVYLMTLESGEQKTLDAAAADYDQLTWSAEGSHLAVLRGDKPRGRSSARTSFSPGGTPARRRCRRRRSIRRRRRRSRKDMVVSEFTSPRWSKDGARLLVGLKEQEAEKPASTDPQANVDVWHWQDDDPQSVQIVQLAQLRRATKAAVLDVAGGTLRQIADDEMKTITPAEDLTWAVGRVETPYAGQIEWGGSKADFYRVNLATGERTLIERGLSRTMGLSPDGKWFLYLKAGRVYSCQLETGDEDRHRRRPQFRERRGRSRLREAGVRSGRILVGRKVGAGLRPLRRVGAAAGRRATRVPHEG